MLRNGKCLLLHACLISLQEIFQLLPPGRITGEHLLSLQAMAELREHDQDWDFSAHDFSF
jgi:hypothetical protein